MVSDWRLNFISWVKYVIDTKHVSHESKTELLNNDLLDARSHKQNIYVLDRGKENKWTLPIHSEK